MIKYLDENNDYELPEGHQSLWVGVDGFSVHLLRTVDGIRVTIYQRGKEMGNQIADTWAFTSELKEDQ